MLPLKALMLLFGLAIFGTSAALVGYDIYLAAQLNRLVPSRKPVHRS